MSVKPLPNYVRAARKERGISQRDLAFLLGAERGSSISRYERFKRIPSLRTALRIQAALGVSAAELFAGLYAEAQTYVAERLSTLVVKAESNRAAAERAKRLRLAHDKASLPNLPTP